MTDVDFSSGSSSPSAAADVLDELFGALEHPAIEIPVPNRPGFSLWCTPVIKEAEQARWAKSARVKEWRPNDPEGMALNNTTFGALLLAAKCVRITRQGVSVKDDDGKDATISSPFMAQRLPKGATHADVIVALFANDLHVKEAASALMEAAGEPVPTATSSTG